MKSELEGSEKKIPVEEGLWTVPSSPGEEIQLIGSRCLSCGELYFPRKKKGLCIHCQERNMEDVTLEGKGKIASFAVVEQAPAGGFYRGPVPYAYGTVHLSDGVGLQTLFAGDLDNLRVGMDVKLVIEKLFDDEEGNEIVTYKFTPV
ncbi:MAG: OB-fold domain-containing protein [Deltaproteobacteria bacterium]|nr:OB-fold domain-containing protein [Deltaproteobacteria bacterium]MBW2095865.1 OB-fold domain-containing protein [Deltaproteobacteria bacterium]